MKNKKLRQVLFVRRAYQMTVVSVVLVMVISIAIVVASGSHSTTTVTCGQVQNIRIEETDTELTVRWEPALDPGGGIPACGRFFFIEYMTNGVAGTPVRFHPDTYYTIEKGSCAHHWFGIRSSLPTGGEGALAEFEHISGIVGDGAVEDLRESNGYAVWSRPKLSENCTLTFRIDMEHKFGTSTNTTDDLTYPLPTIPCLVNTVTVIANVFESGNDGAPTELTYTVAESSVAPVHGSTNPSHVGALVEWVLSDEPNACEFAAIKFELNEDRIERETFDQDIGVITATFTGFPEDNTVSYTARWVLKSGKEGDISDPIFFQTVPLTHPTELTEIIHDGGMTIRWTQDYNPVFVTGHIIQVTNLGPNHLLPDDCETGKDQLYTYPVYNETEREFFFPHSRPHYKYDVEVITLFESLGMNKSSSIIVVTPTDTPGQVTLQERHIFDKGVPYDVTSVLSWSIPCEINGPLREFNYRLTGTFVGQNPSNSIDDELASSTIVSDDSRTLFEIETHLLNPFFVNTLVIETIINPYDGSDDLDPKTARSTSQTILIIKKLPPAYTPPIP